MLKIFVFLSLAFFISTQAYAQSATTTNKARVGNHYFSISGFIAPFASVVLSTESTFLGSTVADQNGDFSMQNVLVNTGLSKFCLEAIDIKKIGTSFTCFEIDPLTSNRSITGIFLPPTLGLSGNVLRPGQSVIASGYGMPNARIFLTISKDIVIDTFADQNGFWQVEIRGIPPGKYNLFATAKFENKDSEIPDRTQELESISVPSFIKENIGVLLALLLLIIIAIITAVILRSKKIKEAIRRLIKGKKPVPATRPDTKEKLHHAWFLGF